MIEKINVSELKKMKFRILFWWRNCIGEGYCRGCLDKDNCWEDLLEVFKLFNTLIEEKQTAKAEK